MGLRRIGIMVLAAGAIAGCGSGTHFANQPAPPVPINMTVYINDQRVSISPTLGRRGAGRPDRHQPVEQGAVADRAARRRRRRGQPLADTGPINPQATTQLTVNLNTPGRLHDRHHA